MRSRHQHMRLVRAGTRPVKKENGLRGLCRIGHARVLIREMIKFPVSQNFAALGIVFRRTFPASLNKLTLHCGSFDGSTLRINSLDERRTLCLFD